MAGQGRPAWWVATPTGLEPATSAVTGRRANQLRYGAMRGAWVVRAPNGIRTRATALKGRRPGPLDDGGAAWANPVHGPTSLHDPANRIRSACTPRLSWALGQHTRTASKHQSAPTPP